MVTWIPEDPKGPYVSRLVKSSAAMNIGELRDLPIMDEVLTEDGTTLLTRPKKFGRAIKLTNKPNSNRIDFDELHQKKLDWAKSAAEHFDNAVFGVTKHAWGPTRLYDSVYYRLMEVDDGRLPWTNQAELVNHPRFQSLQSKDNPYYHDFGCWPQRVRIIAHPQFALSLRNSDGFEAGAGGVPDSLFTIPIFYSKGLKTSDEAAPNPSGDPLLWVGDRKSLIVTRHIAMDWTVDAESGPLSDEGLVKIRGIYGFYPGVNFDKSLMFRMSV